MITIVNYALSLHERIIKIHLCPSDHWLEPREFFYFITIIYSVCVSFWNSIQKKWDQYYHSYFCIVKLQCKNMWHCYTVHVVSYVHVRFVKKLLHVRESPWIVAWTHTLYVVHWWPCTCTRRTWNMHTSHACHTMWYVIRVSSVRW